MVACRPVYFPFLRLADFPSSSSSDAVGISKPYLSQIETGKRKGSTDILSALAKALKVTLEEVIAREAE